MLTIDQFRRLPLSQKALRVWNNATFVACMPDHRLKPGSGAGKAGRSLYYYNGYYVELLYDYQHNRVLGVFPIPGTKHLDEWLDQVNITALLEQ